MLELLTLNIKKTAMFHPSFWADAANPSYPFYGYPHPQDWYLQQLGMSMCRPIPRNCFVDTGYGMFEGSALIGPLNLTTKTSLTGTSCLKVERTNGYYGQPQNIPNYFYGVEKNAVNGTKRPLTSPSAATQQCPNRNTQSNICNQALGFIILRKRSEATLKRILKATNVQDPDAVSRLYYAYASPLKKYQRKYLNRRFLLKICTETDSDPLREVKNCGFYREEELLLDEFMRLTRILVKHFLDVVCPLTVLSSKKLQKSNRKDVLKRRHEIRWFLQESMYKTPTQ